MPLRTISPRHFEAAAFGVCQILFEGHYSGAMEPMRHYIPLRKDFSNFDEVIGRFRDESLRRELAANARRDLVDSGNYGYEAFVAGFDRTLEEAAGLDPEISEADRRAADEALRRGKTGQRLRYHAKDLQDNDFPGKGLLRPLARPLRRGLERLRGRRA